MLSHTVINDVQFYDVICIGNYAAVVADRINSAHPGKYKIVVLHLKDHVKQQFEEAIGSSSISITCKPRKVDLIRRKVQQIVPTQRTIFMEDGQRLTYKFLIYGEDKWTGHEKENSLSEAMKSEYSRVHSSMGQYKDLIQSEGNIIFYVPSGPGSFRQNYPFFKVADQARGKKNVNLVIMVEGESLFPNCPSANKLICQKLESYQVKIIYKVKIQRVDYLRRVLFYEMGEQKCQLPYQSVYCFIGEGTPKLLEEAGINPYNCNKRLLHNNSYDNIYVLGADLYPTTHSFYSLGMQTHHIAQNIAERLTAEEHQKKALLTVYDGSTSFYLHLGDSEVTQIKHKYDQKDYQMVEVGCCWQKIRAWWHRFLVRQFFNFDNFGPPHYLWAPTLAPSQKWYDQIEEYDKSQPLRMSHYHFKTRKTT